MDPNENNNLNPGGVPNSGIGPSAPTDNPTQTPPAPPVADLPQASQKPTMPSTGREPQTIEVKRDALDKLLERVDAIEKENKMLKEIADKGRLAHWESQHHGDVPKIYRLSQYQGQVITGWEMKTNRVWKDEKGLWKETQEIEIRTEDGKAAVIPYIEFVTNTQKIEARLVSTEQKGGKTYFTVEADGGKKITIDSVFIN